MTNKKVFVYKLFLLLSLTDFSLFFTYKFNTPLKKVNPLFPTNSPLKIKVLSNLQPPFENLVGGSTPPPHQKWGVHTMMVCCCFL